ncbi:hypothetical protein M409DRAFT_58651 [Zasmidium cellare ATCC 36951]|uniref:Uncharacterized protein n=1 Tax=Zasmidium cellare ATCC 36951 TaxID=1080233 RepID=A0A6A6C6P5_ZASCE|nr:uncharacterized protein M409DRAFT_58651 [Zasmidium cellare ATCC 36951]KAF2161870.1 hypothetical protein M409DRAFT_58651 [Zasmidium cellare ATCC 36951]
MKPTLTTLTPLLLLLAHLTTAQNCYFPSGTLAPDSTPCFPANSSASVCCPLKWECLSNGLCHLAAENYFGRYSCTDRAFGVGCPGFCTTGAGEAGNEAVLQCADGHWCCDGNRSRDCCADGEAEVIEVPEGEVVAFVSVAPGAMSSGGDATTTTRGSSSATTSTSRTSSSSSTTTQTETETTITTSSATTNAAGVATTILLISTATQALPASPTPTTATTASPSKNNTPLIAALSASLPTTALLLAGLIFLLHRRRKQQSPHEEQDQKPSTSTTTTDTADLPYMYGNATLTGQPPEIDSFPVAAGTSKGGRTSLVSELSGSEVPSQTSPTVSSLHSPIMGKSGFGGLGQVQEEEDIGAVELPAENELDSAAAAVQTKTKDWAERDRRTSYPGYVPYRQEGGEGFRSGYPNPPPPSLPPQPTATESSAAYVAYRPPGSGEGGGSGPDPESTSPSPLGDPTTTAEAEPPQEATQEAPQEAKQNPPRAEAATPPQTPQTQPDTDFDHGQLGAGGLRIVNQ